MLQVSQGSWVGAPAPRAPRFSANWSIIGKGLVEGAMAAGKDAKKGGSSSGWRGFIQRNVIFTTLLTVGLYNADVVYRKFAFDVPRITLPGVETPDLKTLWLESQKKQSQDSGKAPASIDPAQVDKLIAMLNEPKFVATSAFLYQAAQAGLVKEVHTPYTDKPIASGVTAWNAVLLDQRVIKTEVDTELRNKLIGEMGIPVRHAVTGLQLSLLEASMYAALLVNGLSGLYIGSAKRIKRLISEGKFQLPGPTPADRQLMEKQAAGRLIVAAVLDVDHTPLTMEMLEEQTELLAPHRHTQPLTRGEIKRRLVVLMAESAVERLLRIETPDNSPNPDSRSVGSSGSLAMATHIATAMATQLGLGDTLGTYIPAAVPDDKKKALQAEIEQIFTDADQQALAIITRHKEHLEPLVKALKTFRDLSRKEVLMVLEGKTVEDIRQQRRRFFRNKPTFA